MIALSFSNGNAIKTPVHTSLASDVLTVQLCVGQGRYHTGRTTAKNPRPLVTVTPQQIRQVIEAGRDGLLN